MAAVLPRIFQEREPALNHAQKALVEWAKVDDNHAILDTSCGSGALLHHFLSRYTLRACGISASRTEEADAREQLNAQAEVCRASLHDIPWRDDTFHTAFVTDISRSVEQMRAFLLEVLRVLKPQGQALFAMPCAMPLRGLYARVPLHTADFPLYTPYGLMGLLEECGFTDTSMRAYGLRCAVVIAHKSCAAAVDAAS